MGPSQAEQLIRRGVTKYKLSRSVMEIHTTEGESPVCEGLCTSLEKDPEYHGTREIPWESGRTIFQG